MDKFIEFTEKLKERGFKKTNERQIIFNFIQQLNDHFDAEYVYEKLNNKGIKVSRASVYRTLLLLLKNNFIKEISKKDKKTQYEKISDTHHDHIICIRCGKIIEFSNLKIEKIQESVCKKNKFILIDHNLELKGLCSKCQKKRGKI